MGELAAGRLEVAVPGVGRRDEIGEMAAALDVFKNGMIEGERLRAERAELERRAAAERRAEMHRSPSSSRRRSAASSTRCRARRAILRRRR